MSAQPSSMRPQSCWLLNAFTRTILYTESKSIPSLIDKIIFIRSLKPENILID